MTNCQDTAKIAGPVSLFLGIETYNWNMQKFLDVANFAKQHNISSLFIKVSEVGSSAGSYWYGGLAAFDVIYQEVQKIVNVIPYAFVYGDTYGNLQEEITIATTFLSKYHKYCLDMEGSYWAQTNSSASWAKQFSDALLPVPGTLWISCPADPIVNNQLPYLQAIDVAANALMPMAYDNQLASQYPIDFIGLGCLEPTFDLSQEFGTNDVLNNITLAKNAGCLSISLWEYNFANADIHLLDQCVKAFTTYMQWYEYPIVVPFGNVNFDSALGGAHDLDIGCPPNHPITALLAGSVSSITSPAWGMQVGVALDHPINSKPYCAYLHLSAVNPALSVGKHIEVGELIGWCGGANTDAQYAGTTNPTGKNFLNDTFNSSGIQTGFALMNGPEYGVIGWSTFPPIDWQLDPTHIIIEARKGNIPMPDTFNPFAVFLWELSKPALNAMGLNVPPRDTGIFDVLWRPSIGTDHFLGLVASNEIEEFQGKPIIDANGDPVIVQVFSNKIAIWPTNGKKAYVL